MRFHVERETDANIARGMSPDEARRAARLTFGSVDDAHETSRDDRPGVDASSVARDVRFGARLLAQVARVRPRGDRDRRARHRRGDGGLQRRLRRDAPPAPVSRASDRLVNIWWTSQSAEGARLYPSAADVADWRQLRPARSTTSRSCARRPRISISSATANRNDSRARASRPTSSRVLGASPALGRTFANDESVRRSRSRHHAQRRTLAHAASAEIPVIVGQTIRLNGEAYTIIGVMPARRSRIRRATFRRGCRSSSIHASSRAR